MSSSGSREQIDRRADADADVAELAAQVDVLAEENSRLRAAYQDARRTRYRRTALALVLVGLLAVGGGVAFGMNDVLFALGGTGVFAGVLTYYLTPERFLVADVGSDVYERLAANQRAIADALGLSGHRVYVPVGDGIRLFVPQADRYTVPDDLDAPFVATDDDRTRGLALDPTGGPLRAEFAQTRTGETATPRAEVRALADALVEQFELVDVADIDEVADGRAVVGVRDSTFGPLTGFDHPVGSFLGCGLARSLEGPVEVDVTGTDDERYDALVVLSWTPEA